MESIRQEVQSRFLFPTPVDLPNPRIKTVSLVPPELEVNSLQLYHLGSPPLRMAALKTQEIRSVDEEKRENTCALLVRM